MAFSKIKYYIRNIPSCINLKSDQLYENFKSKAFVLTVKESKNNVNWCVCLNLNKVQNVQCNMPGHCKLGKVFRPRYIQVTVTGDGTS